MRRISYLSVAASLVLGVMLCGCDDDGSTEPAAPSDPAPGPAAPEPSVNTIRGTFSINDNPDVVNGDPSTDSFDDVEGVAIDFEITFTVLDTTEEDNSPMGEMERCLSVRIDAITFTGDPSGTLTVVANNLRNARHEMCFLDNGSPVRFRFGNLVGDDSGSIYYGFEMSGVNVPGGALDTEGYPEVMSFPGRGTTVMLRRYTSAPFDMTDFASGAGTIALDLL